MEEIRKTSIKSRMKLKGYWFNRSTVMPKLRKLLETYRFSSLGRVIDTQMEGHLYK